MSCHLKCVCKYQAPIPQLEQKHPRWVGLDFHSGTRLIPVISFDELKSKYPKRSPSTFSGLFSNLTQNTSFFMEEYLLKFAEFETKQGGKASIFFGQHQRPMMNREHCGRPYCQAGRGGSSTWRGPHLGLSSLNPPLSTFQRNERDAVCLNSFDA